jgi:plasmid stabilization system protein ParE
MLEVKGLGQAAGILLPVGQASSLSENPLDRLEACVALIESGPEQWPIFESPVSFLRLRRFPYVIYFERVSDVSDERIQVLAVAHGSRCPGYWRYRRDD